MKYPLFRERFLESGCVSTAEIAAAFGEFDKNCLTRWCGQGFLVQLRNGFYAFPDQLRNADFVYHIANRIYAPSYVSLHSALSYHGYVRAAAGMPVSSVSGRKTASFRNAFGKFDYQKMKQELHFGYGRHIVDGISFEMAYPEKALLDLFYLYPTLYGTEQGFHNFAIEEQMLYENLDVEKLYDYTERFGSRALEQRVTLFVSVFGL
ncbi:MAG: hypothetical protein IJT61_04155 [Bacteroidales bacterium]|nr:hypothetical protein [Bacteroidales bacterium]